MEKAAGGRKRKIALGESDPSTSSFQLKTRRLATAPDDTSSPPVSAGKSTCKGVSSRFVLASYCSIISSCELPPAESSKFVDLEREDDANGESFAVNFRDRREKTPPSTSALRASNNRFCWKMPSEPEVEEFFSAAENDLRKQFITKYNFDIVKDEPTQGRYDWIKTQAKP